MHVDKVDAGWVWTYAVDTLWRAAEFFFWTIESDTWLPYNRQWYFLAKHGHVCQSFCKWIIAKRTPEEAKRSCLLHCLATDCRMAMITERWTDIGSVPNQHSRSTLSQMDAVCWITMKLLAPSFFPCILVHLPLPVLSHPIPAVFKAFAEFILQSMSTCIGCIVFMSVSLVASVSYNLVLLNSVPTNKCHSTFFFG